MTLIPASQPASAVWCAASVVCLCCCYSQCWHSVARSPWVSWDQCGGYALQPRSAPVAVFARLALHRKERCPFFMLIPSCREQWTGTIMITKTTKEWKQSGTSKPRRSSCCRPSDPSAAVVRSPAGEQRTDFRLRIYRRLTNRFGGMQ